MSSEEFESGSEDNGGGAERKKKKKRTVEQEIKFQFEKINADLLSGYRHKKILSSEIRNIVNTRMLKSPIIGSENLTIGELVYQTKIHEYGSDEKDETVTVLVLIETNSVKCVGKLKFKEALPCPLPELLHNYVLPYPDTSMYSIPYSSFSRWIPVSSLPGIASLHRRKSPNFDRDLDERTRWLWRSHISESMKQSITLPNPREEKKKSADQDDEMEAHFCEILSTLFDEKENMNSRLSFLPSEILETVYSHVVNYWRSCIETRGIFASVVAQVTFPKPTGIYCNMMPIMLGYAESIPENMRQYIPLLAACPISRQEFDKIGYLTIHESTIETDGKSQRRGGVHTETPGKVFLQATDDCSLPEDVKGSWQMQTDVPLTVAWGRGLYDQTLGTCYNYIGGLFMASNVSDSCRVWNCQVKNPEEVVGHLGDIQHMRSVLGEGETLKAGEVVWITDCTPHESLPLPVGTKRQYFRLVTSEVSVWYEDHSTPNPLGYKPPEEVKIVKGNKFGTDKQPEKFDPMFIGGGETSTVPLGDKEQTQSGAGGFVQKIKSKFKTGSS